jgi:transcriptional regulator with XRE-family HTH domain
MDEIERGIGPRIAEARRVAGYTQEQLAVLAGSSPRAVQSWEIGARHPRLENLRRLATALDRDISWFYAEPDEKAAA